MKTYILDVPRHILKVDALDEAEARTYSLDVLNKTLDSKRTKIEDITGKKIPTESEARSSRSADSLLVKAVNIKSSSLNITQSLGKVSFLGIGDGNIVFNKDMWESLGLDGTKGVDKHGNMDFAEHLSLVCGK